MSVLPIIIVGAGPAGLIAAQRLASKGFEVHVFEQNKAAGRKFLVAGHGGFNLTHSENVEAFITKYDREEIQCMVRYFDNDSTIYWLKELGISTFVGSSGKIFPMKGTKPIQVLQAILQKLETIGVKIHYGYRMVDFDEQTVTFTSSGGPTDVRYNKLILGLGGGSWAKTGSDGKWVNLFVEKGIQVKNLQPANSGLHTNEKFTLLAGEVLKNIVLKFGEYAKTGEIVFTSYGIEGSPVYYFNRFIRQEPFPVKLYIDLKPSLQEGGIEDILRSAVNIRSTLEKRLNLSITAIQLLKFLDKETYTAPDRLAAAIKNYPLEVSSFRPIDEVISTAGGVSFDELSSSLALKKYPDVFCVGEMLDWEAPTGGYLLQACFSTGAWVAECIK